jgi:hypothetical protein
MQQLLKTLPGAVQAEVVPAQLLGQLLVAVDDTQPGFTAPWPERLAGGSILSIPL